MNDKQKTLQRIAFIVAHLIRALMRGATKEALGEHRFARRQTELNDNLMNIVVQSKTSFEFFGELARRFGVDPGDAARGTHRGPIEIMLDNAWIRWDAALAQVPHDLLRLVLSDCPTFFATFALHPMFVDKTDATESSRIDYEAEAALFEREWPTGDDEGWRWTPPTDAIFAGRWAAMLTTIEPLHHGADQKTGNVSTFRTEPTHDPLTGRVHKQVPLITGGAWRGQARDLWMADALALLGLDKRDIPNGRLHELFSGGTLEKGADSATVNVALRETTRRLLPMWDLLGGVTRAQVMEGRLHAGDMMVVCKENAWRCWDLVRPRSPSGELMPLADWVPLLKRAEQYLSGTRFGTRMAHREIPESDGAQMIFHDQVLLVGTPIVHTLGLYCLGAVTSLHRSTLARGLRVFQEQRAKIGAKGSRGMGGVTFGAYEPVHGPVELPSDEEYLAYVAEHTEESREFLTSTGRYDAATGAKPVRGKGKTKVTDCATDETAS